MSLVPARPQRRCAAQVRGQVWCVCDAWRRGHEPRPADTLCVVCGPGCLACARLDRAVHGGRVRGLCGGRVDARRLPGVPGPGEGEGGAVERERGEKESVVRGVGEGEWARGQEDDVATLGSALRADAVDVNRVRSLHLPPTGSSRTHAPARQVGGVGRVPRKDEVSPSWPSPMHSVTRGLEMDKGRFLYHNRSRLVVASPLAAASLVLDRASVQLYVVLVVEGVSWRCASLSATLRIPLRA